VLVLGELDSVICPEHPESDPDTGAVHACGHNAQSAALLGIAAALAEEGLLDRLCGKIKLCAVRAQIIDRHYMIKMRVSEKNLFKGKPVFIKRPLDLIGIKCRVDDCGFFIFAVNYIAICLKRP
jgi:hypothetical protein